jgi:L-fuconolactonase
MPFIDAHHHLWHYTEKDYGWITDHMSVLRHDFLIPELTAVTKAAGVTGTVVVQARQTVGETEWLLGLAAHHPILKGVVGWVSLIDAGVEGDLARYVASPKLKGVRHVLQDESDDAYMLRADFNRGVSLLQRHSLVFDILIFERHLQHAIEFVDRHPKQIFVVDHVAKPRIKENIVTPWAERIRELAKRPHVYCKVSGMVTEADWATWTPKKLKPYFDTVLNAFSPQRLMFGSDWPVATLATTYQQWVDTVKAWIAPLSAPEQERILGGTAIEAYKLQA